MPETGESMSIYQKVFLLAVVLSCALAGASTQVLASSVTVAWDAPTLNSDGTSLTDLAGYKLGYGRAAGTYDQTLDVGNVTSKLLSGLVDGVTYYAAAKAYNTAGRESANCAELVFTAPDQTPPVITAPAARTLDAGSDGKAPVPNLVTGLVVTDNLTIASQIVVTQSPTNSTRIGLGVTTVTLRATDASGNASTSTVALTVVDRTGPVITAPADVVLTGDANDKAAVPNFLTSLVVVDNCTTSSAIVKAQSPTAGTQVGLGITTVTITATDAAGNTSQVTAKVTVNPMNRAPVVLAGSDVQTTGTTSVVTLAGSVTDDGLPSGSSLTVTWSLVSGPGTVSFGNASAAQTTATFSRTGTYVLRLRGSDGTLSTTDDVQVTIRAESVPAAPSNLRVVPTLP
jgi:hypothetical protein